MILIRGLENWSPLMFLFCAAIIAFIIYLINSSGEKGYKKETEKSLIFFSGNLPPKDKKISNIYWGFFQAMNKYYKWMKNLHSGIVNDYIYCFALIMVIILILSVFGVFI